MTTKINAEQLLLKSAEEIEKGNVEATPEGLFKEFFQSLEATIMGAIGEQPTQKGSLTKAADQAALAGMSGLLERVAKLSDADLKDWLARGQFDDAATFNHDENVDEGQRMHRPDNPDAGWGASPPGSSRPAGRVTKAMAGSLDKLAGATPEEVDRAKTGLSQLDPGETPAEAATFEQLGAEVYKEFYHGNINSETELRKSLVRNAALLVQRVQKMRQAERSKQVILEGDKDDDWEARARQGRG